MTNVDRGDLFNGMLFPFAVVGCLVLLASVLALYTLVLRKLPRRKRADARRKRHTKFHRIMDDADQVEVELCARSDDYIDDDSEDEDHSHTDKETTQAGNMRMNVLTSMM